MALDNAIAPYKTDTLTTDNWTEIRKYQIKTILKPSMFTLTCLAKSSLFCFEPFIHDCVSYM